MRIGGSFTRSKAAGTWSSPVNPIYCWDEEWVELYLHSPYTFMALTALTLSALYLHSIHFKHKLYSSMAGFSCFHQGWAFGFHFTDRNFSDALQTCRKELQGQTQRYRFSMLTFHMHLTYPPTLAIIMFIIVTSNACHSLHKTPLRSKMEVHIFTLY
jgi:hypothetical protein